MAILIVAVFSSRLSRYNIVDLAVLGATEHCVPGHVHKETRGLHLGRLDSGKVEALFIGSEGVPSRRSK